MPAKKKVAAPKMGTQSTLKSKPSLKEDRGVFKPPDLLEVRNKDERFAYRALNIKKLEANGYRDYRGWEVVCEGNESGEVFGGQTTIGTPSGKITGVRQAGDLVLASMPKEKAIARNEYYSNRASVRQEMIRMKKEAERDDFQRLMKYKSQKAGQVLGDYDDRAL